MRGIIWSKDQLPANCVINEDILEMVAEVKELILRDKSKPVLISGEPGVGKSAIINIIANSLQEEHGVYATTVTGPNLKAGNKYIGMIEEAVEKFLRELQQDNYLWIAPEFLQIYYAAKHDDDPMGVLDMIMPYLKRGEIKLIGEINESDLERLISLHPDVKNVFEVFKIIPGSKSETLELANQWIEKDEKPEKWQKVKDDHLEELFFISRQYLSAQENPGALLNFFKYTNDKFKNDKKPLELELFYEALSSFTGLPISI